MPTPKWYIDLVELAPFISNKDWPSVHAQALVLNKELFVKAPTARTEFEDIVLLTMNPDKVSAEKEKLIKIAYDKSMAAADKEVSTADFDRVMREETIFDQLDLLSDRVNSSLRIIWNYWWGIRCSDYQEWEDIKKEIDTTPLTRLGRLRLLARHDTIGKRLLPSFMKMIVQLWPIAAVWIIKNIGTSLISSTVSKTIKSHKTKRKLKDVQKRLRGKEIKVGDLRKKPKKKK